MKKRSGEYAERGDYHANLRKDWPYLPVYLEKMKMARELLNATEPHKVVFDMGCGEGILVDEYRRVGYAITGMDLNYASEHILQKNFLNSGLEDSSVDLILCLDVLEHMPFHEQELAVAEFARVLSPQGRAFVSVPNLAHFASRLSFFFRGELIRTSSIERHPGDRPIGEYIRLFNKHFAIRSRKGLFPTFLMLSLLTVLAPSSVIGLHRYYNRFFAPPNLCFLNVFLLEKRST